MSASPTSNNDAIRNLHSKGLTTSAKVKVSSGTALSSGAVADTDPVWNLHLHADVRDVAGVVRLVLDIHVVRRETPYMSRLSNTTQHMSRL